MKVGGGILTFLSRLREAQAKQAAQGEKKREGGESPRFPKENIFFPVLFA